MTNHINTHADLGSLLTAHSFTHRVCNVRDEGRRHIQELRDYMRAYRSYVSASLGWAKALRLATVWLAALFLPHGAKTFVQLPEWAAISWMIGWAMLGNVFAPYGMWKQSRAEIASTRR
jgi:hypothetical protein